jgi:ABC-type transport system involved in cytochrome c biogenesis permease subunit
MIHNILANFSFISLFSSMLLFWIYASFFFTVTDSVPKEFATPSKTKIKNNSEIRSAGLEFQNLPLQLGNLGMFFSNIALFVLLLLRWKESGHFPLSNLYESLIFLSWSSTFIHFAILWNSLSMRNFLPFAWNATELSTSEQLAAFHVEGTLFRNTKTSVLTKLTGCITSPCALFTNCFASFSLPEEMQKIAPLVPALQSNWLMMHVTVMIISYSALIIGSLLSIAFLVITQGKAAAVHATSVADGTKDTINLVAEQGITQLAVGSPGTEFRRQQMPEKKKPQNPEQGLRKDPEQSSISSGSFVEMPSRSAVMIAASEQGLFYKNDLETVGHSMQTELRSAELKEMTLSGVGSGWLQRDRTFGFAETLDNLSYRIIGLGFPFLTIGILSGAVWANEAWGSYWSWDPKETWALLTWLVFAMYLHTRISKGWQGKKPAIIAAAGFLVIWICYLGVNLLGEGLHSYGWLQNSVPSAGYFPD